MAIPEVMANSHNASATNAVPRLARVLNNGFMCGINYRSFSGTAAAAGCGEAKLLERSVTAGSRFDDATPDRVDTYSNNHHDPLTESYH